MTIFINSRSVTFTSTRRYLPSVIATCATTSGKKKQYYESLTLVVAHVAITENLYMPNVVTTSGTLIL